MQEGWARSKDHVHKCSCVRLHIVFKQPCTSTDFVCVLMHVCGSVGSSLEPHANRNRPCIWSDYVLCVRMAVRDGVDVQIRCSCLGCWGYCVTEGGCWVQGVGQSQCQYWCWRWTVVGKPTDYLDCFCHLAVLWSRLVPLGVLTVLCCKSLRKWVE